MPRLTIGQLAKRLGLRTSALRYYEAQGLLQPASRSEAGYRLYEAEAEQTLYFIQRAQRLGFSLSDIKTLVASWQAETLAESDLIQIAEARYITLEKQLTPLLVLRHELQLFLQDLHHSPLQPAVNTPTSRQPSAIGHQHFDQILAQICRNPFNQPVEAMLDWLIEQIGCQLGSQAGQDLLKQLRGQHIHIWQVEQDYHILVISHDPAIGQALKDLARLEQDCLASPQPQSFPEVHADDEGHLFIARGPHAFLFARLFLALEMENEKIED